MVTSANLMSILPTVAPSIVRATSRWQELWRATTTKLGQDYFQVTALSRQCNEFCCLLQKIIQISLSGGKLPPYLETVGHETVADLYNFILEH